MYKLPCRPEGRLWATPDDWRALSLSDPDSPDRPSLLITRRMRPLPGNHQRPAALPIIGSSLWSRLSGKGIITMTNPRRLLAAIALAAISATPIAAAPGRAGPITITGPWARETAIGQSVGGGFASIANTAASEDRLVAATSPIAGEVQLHTMSMQGGVMRMRQVTGGMAVPARGKLELRLGGFHLMFVGLKRQLRQGEHFPVTLRFQRAGRVTVRFAVQPVGSAGAMEARHAGH